MDADRHGKAVCRSKPAAVLHPSLFHRIARRWKAPACLNAAGVRRMPPGRPGRGKAAQGEEPQEGGARGNAPPNFEHSTTADRGKQGTKSRKKHGLLLIRGSGPPSLCRPAKARVPVHAAGSGPFCVPAPASIAFKEAGGVKVPGTKRSAARGAPAWPGADGSSADGPGASGERQGSPPQPSATWLPQAPEGSRRSPLESA